MTKRVKSLLHLLLLTFKDNIEITDGLRVSTHCILSSFK